MGPQVAADRGCDRDVVKRMHEGYKAGGALKSVLNNRISGINAHKCLYEVVISIVLTALHGCEKF